MRALLLIDFQNGFRDAAVWGTRNNPGAEANAAALLAHWRASGAPVLHVRHLSNEPGSPLGKGTAGAEIMGEVAPLGSEPLFEKSVNSGFIGTGLEAHLCDAAITDLVICGLTTPHCVSTTARMAANLGFGVTLAHDACAAFDSNADTSWGDGPAMSADEIHRSAVSHLHGEFAMARATKDLLSDHP